MRLWPWVLLGLTIALPLPARADDVLARERFEEGVAAAAAGRWEDATRAFEASTQELDRAASRYNLVLSNAELDRPLEVTRHALAFLAFPETPGLAEARVTVQTLLASARAKLAVLSLEALPPEAQLLIDGVPPLVVHERRAYLAPGRHELVLRHGNGQDERASVDLSPGQTRPWPRAPAPPPLPPRPVSLPAQVPPAPPPISHAPFRRPLAWSLGVTGALSFLVAGSLYVTAELKASDITSIQANDPENYIAYANRYTRLKWSTMTLAFTGGALMASAVVAGEQPARRGSRGWAIGSLVLGGSLTIAGSVLMAQQPDTLVQDTKVQDPTREGASLLLSAALPLIAYGIAYLVRHARVAAVERAIPAER